MAQDQKKDVASATSDKEDLEEFKRLLSRRAIRASAAPDTTAELVSQEKLALQVRDDISKLSDVVARLRAIKKQLDLRKELLKDQPEAKDLLKQSEALDKKLDGIEEKLHNPRAKITYDILAQKGGAMLYSQFAWLLGNLTDSDGAPTKAQRELTTELEKELDSLTMRFETLAKNDIAQLNTLAHKLGVPELYVPPRKKPGEEASGKK
jgi:hypothetical protein